jgi:hypothetical protein
MGAPRKGLYAVITVVLSALGALLAAEGTVRLLEGWRLIGPGRQVRYEEAYGAAAFRPGGLGPAGFLAEGFAGEVSDEYGRPVPWINDSLGFRSRREYPPTPRPGTLRILSLGDSFTAGYRVGQEDTFSFLIEDWLRRRGDRADAEVLIAAIEEPATGLYYLTTRGLDFQPQVVLLGITLGNDLGQVFFDLAPRGRYRLPAAGSDGVIEENPASDAAARRAVIRRLELPERCTTGLPAAAAPPPAPGLSHLLDFVRRRLAGWRGRNAPQAISSTFHGRGRPRLFDSNGLGIFLSAPPEPVERAYRRLFAVLRGYQAACERRGVRLVVVLFPQRYQVQPGDWQATVARYRLDPGCFDLEAPNRAIAGFCRRRGLACLDPTRAMAERYRESGDSLYFPDGDMHWNRAGHRALFEAIREGLAAQLPPPER